MKLDRFFKDVVSFLPKAMKKSLPKNIILNLTEIQGTNLVQALSATCTVMNHEKEKIIQSFLLSAGATSSLTSESAKGSEIDDSEAVDLGKVTDENILSSSPRVYLNRGFVSEILKGPLNSTPHPCGSWTLFQLAQVTLIKELARIYDIQAGSISKSARYQELMNWDVGFFGSESKNRLAVRSPDPSELTDISESFAVNLALFIIDSNFSCRRPELARFFSEDLQLAPAVSPSCTINTKVNLTNSAIPVDLDVSRIYEIHYLLAEKGKNSESKWGHAMFRIIMCSKKRSSVGPDCLKDQSDHIVANFRADPPEFKLNKAKAFFGFYPSRLILSSLSEIEEEYTVGEDRDLKSIPLKLNRRDIQKFINRLLEEYWAYEGSYSFLGNNCATESLTFLKASTGLKLKKPFLPVTPINLYQNLSEKGLLDEKVLSASNAEGRYLFSSFLNKVESSFHWLQKLNSFPEDMTADTFLKLSAEQRWKIYESLQVEVKNLIRKTKNENYENINAHFYNIERAIFEKEKHDLMQARQKLLDWDETEFGSENKATQLKNAYKQMGFSLKQMAELRLNRIPWTRTYGGYGIPLTQEVENPLETWRLNQDIEKVEQKLMAESAPLFEKENLRLQSTAENMKKITTYLLQGS
ncbi:MAG: lipoprotein N-acyltransferase Lnb domain-containing protein [Bdellovibrio sp.]